MLRPEQELTTPVAQRISKYKRHKALLPDSYVQSETTAKTCLVLL